jgi:hypothetical protein
MKNFKITYMKSNGEIYQKFLEATSDGVVI